jgi:hypothetical protein
MAILLIWSVLLGAVLGRFFKVFVLVPACTLILAAVIVRSADVGHGLLRSLLEFAVLITSLQIGYASGMLSHLISSRNATEKSARARALLHQLAATGTGNAARGAARHRRINYRF